MSLSPSYEATSFSATQEFLNNPYSQKIHYYVHMNPPLVPNLSHMNPVYIMPSYLRSILILSSRLCLGPPPIIIIIIIIPFSFYRFNHRPMGLDTK
jgi:hypothetical protein